MELTNEQEKEIKKLGKYFSRIQWMTSEENTGSLEEGFRNYSIAAEMSNRTHNPHKYRKPQRVK